MDGQQPQRNERGEMRPPMRPTPVEPAKPIGTPTSGEPTPRGFWARLGAVIREYPIIVLFVIVLVFLGISAGLGSRDETEGGATPTGEATPTATGSPSVRPTEGGLATTRPTTTPKPSVGGGTIVTKDGVPTAFTEKAARGEGITHLARKALRSYLDTTKVNINLTKEHKIFIEDYLQNRTGSELLNLDETRTFSTELIVEAINAAQALSPSQLANLSVYAANVANL
ncbi:MAG: hypothetical protein HY459_01980 [Parcubacteria group bacterium]|nr:hypothetical protein [Parcubacteria group bacterium]